LRAQSKKHKHARAIAFRPSRFATGTDDNCGASHLTCRTPWRRC